MFVNKSLGFWMVILSGLGFLLMGCQSETTPTPIVETQVVTEEVEATPVEVIEVATPTMEPEGPRTLVVCIGAEPTSLFPYGEQADFSSLVSNTYAEGNWGAYDANSYAYQPILLEKLPNLADGDASLSVVTVSEGDRVVDANSQVVTLDPTADPAIMVNPAGSGEPVPYEGGELEMEQLSATFRLLPGLLWSDGTPMTAMDSVYAFKILSDPDTPSSNFSVSRTMSYEAVDETTIVWTGLPGYVDSSYYTNFFGPAPEHVWGQYTVKEMLEPEVFARNPVGFGPYIIDEWVPGEGMTLHKNPNYFRAAEGLPKFDNLVIRFVGENANANIAAILSGECDLVDETGDLIDQIDQVLELHEASLLKATFTTGTTWEQLNFGIQHVDYDDGYQPGADWPDFFSDVRTRQAFALCMDRQALVDEILFGQSLVIDSYLPPQHPLFNPDAQHYEFDPAAGSALLEEVGWLDEDGGPTTARTAQGVPNVPDGTRLELTYDTTTSVLRQRTQAILQESLAQCGIVVDTQSYNPGELFAEGPEGSLYGRKFDLVEFAWATGVRPPCDLFLSHLTPGPTGETWTSIQDGQARTFGPDGWYYQNFPGFADQAYDTACSSALTSLPGQPEYEAAHKEAQRIFAEQLPVVPLYLHIKLAATRPDFCGLIMDPTAVSLLWNVEEFDYGEGCEG